MKEQEPTTKEELSDLAERALDPQPEMDFQWWAHRIIEDAKMVANGANQAVVMKSWGVWR